MFHCRYGVSRLFFGGRPYLHLLDFTIATNGRITVAARKEEFCRPIEDISHYSPWLDDNMPSVNKAITAKSWMFTEGRYGEQDHP